MQMIRLIFTIMLSALALVSMGTNDCATSYHADIGDSLCNLIRGDSSLHGSIFRTPDKVGNIYREAECRGRKYDRGGKLLDVYGAVMECRGDRTLVPFRYQGQYEDVETGLYYNRFRYYDPSTGNYISSDPIGLAGNNPTLYGYVDDTNAWIDVLGLQKSYNKEVKQLQEGENGTVVTVKTK